MLNAQHWRRVVIKKLFNHVRILDISQSTLYLERWSMRLPFGCSIKVHHILRPDDDRCQHNHPWSFWTFVLWGGYIEQVAEHNVRHHMKWLHGAWRPHGFRHRIIELPRGHSWTLILVGKTQSTWGFFTQAGFVAHHIFVATARTARIMWCHDGSKTK